MRWKRIFGAFGIGITILVVLTAIAASALYFAGFFDFPDFSLIDDKRETSIFYDERGTIIREYCEYCREITTLGELGEFPKFAVAVEDRMFFKRRFGALSFRAILRAFWDNFTNFSIKQGGSTITQQVARMLFLGKELARELESDSIAPSLWRKAREAWIATLLDRKISREKILELYLNNIFCGHGRHGVKACSRWYFKKDTKNLSIAETALLVGLWRKPSCSPFLNKECAKELRGRVLEQLYAQDLISESEKRESLKAPIPIRQDKYGCHAEHFAAFVRRNIIEKRRLVDQGLKVYTTINCDLQNVAEAALRASMDMMIARNPELATDLRGAALLVDARTGAIKVWTVEPSFSKSEYDPIYQGEGRHTGSAFKPFAYGTWIEKRGAKLSPDDQGEGPWELDDSSDTDGDGKSLLSISMGEGRDPHQIQNFPYEGETPRYRGKIPAILALAESRNAATMSMVSRVRNSGVLKEHRISKEEIIEFAVRLGISAPKVDPGLTIALGSIDASLFKMVRAWTGFLGTLIQPYAIEGIDDAHGKELEQTEMQSPLPAIEEKTSRAILRGLRAAIEYIHDGKYVGTGKLAKRELDFQVMGKTGTATNNKGETTDNWFIGCTPSYCMGVWIGRDKKLPMKATLDPSDPEGKLKIQETGSKNCLIVFTALMGKLFKEKPRESFPEGTDPNKPFVYSALKDKTPIDTSKEPILEIELNTP